MQYFVVLPDGQKFGPADLQTLNVWAAENRVPANAEIEDIATMVRIPATTFPGLNLPGPATTSEQWTVPPSQGSPYPRSQAPTSSAAGSTELTLAWVLGAVTIGFCCPILPGVGLHFANKAISLGNAGGQAAKTFNIVVLILTILVYLGYGGFIVAMIASGW